MRFKHLKYRHEKSLGFTGDKLLCATLPLGGHTQIDHPRVVQHASAYIC